MKKIGLIWLVVLVLVTGCGSKLTNENLLKVKNGMKEEEVKMILGKPDRIETSEAMGFQGTAYFYKTEGSEVKVVFLNGGVLTKEGSFK